jgi:hypothetical protein
VQKSQEVKTKHKTLTTGAKAYFYFCNHDFFPSLLTSVFISQPLKSSYSEKVNHFIIFDEMADWWQE